jgi:hypothetical protein
MQFRRHLPTGEMLDPGTDRLVRTPIEVRIDPLTGHSSRILPERGLMPANDVDLEAFPRENQPALPVLRRADRAVHAPADVRDRSGRSHTEWGGGAVPEICTLLVAQLRLGVLAAPSLSAA